MGLFDAMTTSVSGLQAQSFAMQNISGNIANSQTTAYKDITTNFTDLVPDNIPSQQVAGGVIAVANNLAALCPNVELITAVGDPAQILIHDRNGMQQRVEQNSVGCFLAHSGQVK